MLNTSSSVDGAAATFRSFGFCSREHAGGAVMIFLNTAATDSVTVEVSLLAGSETVNANGTREEFHITSRDRNLSAVVAQLNGADLTVGLHGQVPELSGRVVGASTALTIQPLSYGFVVFPDAALPACKPAVPTAVVAAAVVVAPRNNPEVRWYTSAGSVAQLSDEIGHLTGIFSCCSGFAIYPNASFTCPDAATFAKRNFGGPNAT